MPEGLVLVRRTACAPYTIYLKDVVTSASALRAQVWSSLFMVPADIGDRRILFGSMPEVNWLLSRLRYLQIRRSHLALTELSN